MGGGDRALIFTTLDILLTLLNQALCPQRLTCMDYINSLPCPLASVWVQLVGCPVRRSKRRRVRSGYLYPWLLPCKISSGSLCPLTKRLLLFFKKSTTLFSLQNEFSQLLFTLSFFWNRDGNSSMAANPRFWHYSVPNSVTGLFVNKSSSNYPNLRVPSVFLLGS